MLYYCGIVLLVAGVIVFFLPAIKALMKAGRCKMELEGECIEEVRFVDYFNTEMMAPTFRYSYNGKDFETKYPLYHYPKEIVEGESYPIRINEKKPEDIYVPMPLKMYFASERMLPAVITLAFGYVFVIA